MTGKLTKDVLDIGKAVIEEREKAVKSFFHFELRRSRSRDPSLREMAPTGGKIYIKMF